MPTFRPSAQVTLDIRVEEFNDTAALESRLVAGRAPGVQIEIGQAQIIPTTGRIPLATAPSLADRLATLTGSQREIERMPDEMFEALGHGTREFMLRDLSEQREAILDQMTRPRIDLVIGEAQILPPEAVVGTAPDDRHVRSGILPSRVDIERNSFRTADTCTIILNWKDVPFDPRLVRACAVDVRIGVVSTDDYADGVRGARGPTGQLTSVIAPDGSNAIPGASARFFGFVDTWSIDYDGDDGDKVTLECRDLTALFLDTPMASGISINLDLPLDAAIRDFIGKFPTVAGIPVVFQGTRGPGETTPAPIVGQSIPTQLRTRRGRVARQARTGDQRMNLWDHITDVCQQAGGFIPTIRGTEFHILDPRTLYLSDPASPVRHMVYGRNLSALHFSRKLAGVRVPTIEVRCYDASIGRTRWARYPCPTGSPASGIFGVVDPPRPSRANDPTPSGSVPDEKIQTIGLRGISDPIRLETAARNIFEQTGRQEIEGNFSTAEHTSWDVVTDTPASDLGVGLLGMEAGDSVELLVAPALSSRPTLALTASVLQSLSRQARAEYLRRLGWDGEVADRFAQLQEASGFQTIFRIQNSRITLDAKDGLEVACDFINYVEIREQAPANRVPPADLPTGAMQGLLAGAAGPVGAALQRVRDLRSQLLAQRESGQISEDSYQERLRSLRDEEHTLARAAREV